jgi:hypothetical protein
MSPVGGNIFILYLLGKNLQAFATTSLICFFNVFQQNPPTQQIDQLNTCVLKVLRAKLMFYCAMTQAIFQLCHFIFLFICTL